MGWRSVSSYNLKYHQGHFPFFDKQNLHWYEYLGVLTGGWKQRIGRSHISRHLVEVSRRLHPMEQVSACSKLTSFACQSQRDGGRRRLWRHLVAGHEHFDGDVNVGLHCQPGRQERHAQRQRAGSHVPPGIPLVQHQQQSGSSNSDVTAAAPTTTTTFDVNRKETSWQRVEYAHPRLSGRVDNVFFFWGRGRVYSPLLSRQAASQPRVFGLSRVWGKVPEATPSATPSGVSRGNLPDPVRTVWKSVLPPWQLEASSKVPSWQG